jgi:uncharacterized protein YodC (DUF2158 family)
MALGGMSEYGYGGEIQMGDLVRVVSINKSGFVTNKISNGKHYTIQFVNGDKNVYDKNDIEKIMTEEEYADGGMVFKKGDMVILKDGGGRKSAMIVEDGFDKKNRVRVRPDGFPMDISVPMSEEYSSDKRVYVLHKMADGGMFDDEELKQARKTTNSIKF